MKISLNNSYSDRARNILKRFPLLILFYMFPREAVEQLGLLNLPRNPLQFIADEHWLRLYSSKAFPKRLMQKWADLMWRHLNVRGTKLNYSKNDPMNILVHDHDTWLEVAKIIGRDLDHLATWSLALTEIPYWNKEELKENFDILANYFWNHPTIKGGDIYEIVKKHRAYEDYAKRQSFVRTDFYRSYYHTQSSIQTVPYNSATNDIERLLPSDLELENIDLDDSVQSFLNRLTGEHDSTIFRLLYLSYTQEEIAKHLGLASHSAVSKRLAIIRKEYIKYQAVDELPKPSAEKIKQYA